MVNMHACKNERTSRLHSSRASLLYAENSQHIYASLIRHDWDRESRKSRSRKEGAIENGKQERPRGEEDTIQEWSHDSGMEPRSSKEATTQEGTI